MRTISYDLFMRNLNIKERNNFDIPNGFEVNKGRPARNDKEKSPKNMMNIYLIQVSDVRKRKQM